jgi:hypothetical protein
MRMKRLLIQLMVKQMYLPRYKCHTGGIDAANQEQ